jgi:hypothetical protein
MDTSATNAYFVTASTPEEDTQHRAYRKFQENLTIQLLAITEDGPEQVVEQAQGRPETPPRWIPIACQSYCVWRLQNKETASQKAESPGGGP